MNLDDLISRGTNSPDDRWDICAELYNALDAGVAEPINLAPYAPSFALFWRDVDEQVRPFQQQHGHSWRWQEDYQDPRNEAGLLLDILGYVPGPEVESELRKALTLADQRLVMYAALALLRQGHVLAPETLEGVAACDETRNTFQQSLIELQCGYLFPPAHADSESTARSRLVTWLTHPNEWECAPDEVERLGIVDRDVYVYRFRTHEEHWTSRHGWVAGIAGRAIFSDYTAADSASVEDHALRMLAALEEQEPD